jgi:chemotaxis methyl-accepting protein methylase
MHRLMAGTILEHELSELRLLVERQTGILLDCPNSVLANHAAEYLESQELDSSAALLGLLRSSEKDPTVMQRFLDGVLNANTSFFRHPGAMNALTKQVFPQLHARKSGDGSATLRIWSAGCSTGEEAYSIAMALCNPQPAANGNGNSANGNGANGNGKVKDKTSKEKSPARTGGIADTASLDAPSVKDLCVHIIGSDLLPSAIKVAERGLYPQSALAGLPPAIIRACFSKIGSTNGSAGNVQNNPQELDQDESAFGSDVPNNGVNGNSNRIYSNSNAQSNGSPNGSFNGAHLLVKPRLRSLVTFNTMNLTKPVYIGRFDCIFCMDVLPHLSRAQRTALLERLHLYLEPGGYLFLSQTEKLSAPNLNFRSETFDGYTFHRKPLAASAAYGR